jgi:hypothetical protein
VRPDALQVNISNAKALSLAELAMAEQIQILFIGEREGKVTLAFFI